jgi:hypothetical protein
MLAEMAVMAVGWIPFPSDLSEEGKPSNIPVVFAGLVVVLVERADLQSVAGLGPKFYI